MFQRPTLAELIQRTVNDFNSRLSGTDATLRRANTRALATVLSGAVHGLYGYLDFIAQQIIYDTASSEYLERWTSIWNIARKAAEFASGPVTFSGTSGSVIPEGTEWQRSDGNLYTVDADVTLVNGSGSGTVTASVAGADGNVAEGSSLTLVTSIEGVSTSATIGTGGLTGGLDDESDDDLRGRLLDRVRQTAHGGAAFDYVNWAKEVSGVTRAWPFPLKWGLGTVGVTFVCDNQEGTIIPTPEKVAEVQAYINERRPATAAPTVYAPTAKPINFTIIAVPDTQAVRTAIAAELADLISLESEPDGVILLSRINEAISLAAGEEDHSLIAPIADISIADYEIGTMGVITWA
jgi:uncharacterized phage protein gp47/JayE